LPQDREDRSFTAPGCNCEFHVAVLDIEHRIRRIALVRWSLYFGTPAKFSACRSFFRRSLAVKVECVC
jgi:hypothetical protein